MMAAVAAVTARQLAEPVLATSGYSDGIAPSWLVALCCGLGDLHILVERIQVLVGQLVADRIVGKTQKSR